MYKMCQKILSIVLALLYFGTTTGFGVVHCNHLGQLKVIFANEKFEKCVCNTQKAAMAKDDCCSHENTTNNLYSNSYKIVPESSDSGTCCSFSFQKLNVQTVVYSKVNNYNSANYSYLFSPTAIIPITNFVLEKNICIFQKKPSNIALQGHTALIYQFCQMRN